MPQQQALAPPSIRDRVGGRWAISFRTFAVGAVMTVMVGFLGVRLSPWHDQTTPLSLALLISALAAWLLLLDRTILRRRRERPVPVWVVFAAGGAFGLIRLAILAGLAHASGVLTESPTLVALTAVSATAISSLVMPIVAYASATDEWYRGERERLIALAAVKEAARLRAVGALDAMRDVALVAAQRDVDSARDVLDDTRSAPSDVAQALLTAARAGVRPAAHDLLQRPAPATRRAPLLGALHAEALRAPLPLLAPAVLFPALIAPRVYVFSGAEAMLIAVALGASGIVGVFALGRHLIHRLPRWALLITVLACAVAPLPIAIALGLRSDVRSPALLAVLLIFTLLAIVLVASMRGVVDSSSAAILRQLQEPVRAAEIERIAAERARDELLREVGVHLHGTVQTGLVAASYAIQDALERQDDEALDLAVAQAREVLSQRMSPTSEPVIADVDPRELVDPAWRGLITVDWQGVEGRRPGGRAIAAVVRESLANAVVHGRATAAIVRVSDDGHDAVVEIEDNGSGPAEGVRGLGAAVLDDATGRRWSIERAPSGGALVRARIAI